MLLYSWNVNGYRAVLDKGFGDWLGSCGADVVCLQETKVHPDQLTDGERDPQGWSGVWNPSQVRKGYSGTACLCRVAPHAVSLDLPDPAFGGEGRLIKLEYPAFHLLNVYFPNGQMSEARLRYKLGYYDAFLEYAESLRRDKPVVVCGDFNTAHREIDLARPAENAQTSGFLPVERAWMDRFEAAGYVDSFRLLVPEAGHYSWWSYRGGARGRNVGWRIDYFFVSAELQSAVREAWIEPEVMGSDHCPVGLRLMV